MKRLGIVALAVALVAGMLAGFWSSVVRAQPAASIALPPPRATVQLYSGCNNLALTFPDGTASEVVVQAVTPAGVVEAMWRHNAAQNMFEGFSPAAPQASDLLTVNLWDAVWLCIAEGAPALPSPPIAATPTSVPPMAPTPIPIPTIAPTPVPSPTKAAESFTTRKTSEYTDAIGVLHIVGEVQNNSSSDAEFVEIAGTFFDQAGNVLASDFTYSCVSVIPAGGDSPFDLTILSPPSGIVRYTLQVQGEQASHSPTVGLSVSGTTTRSDSLGAFHIAGLVTNSSHGSYDYVEVCGALYDGAGNVVRADFTYTDPKSLTPGQSSSFDYMVMDAPAVASYRLWVQGEPM